jgi:hydroxymethylpyrimidine pyrophosphatase-like HAD family hydrolase
MIDKIVVLDFDGTLCYTPGPEEGKKIWEEKTDTVFPYPGWWSKKETLDLNIFNIPVNPFVYKKYLEAVADNNTYVVLATGRLVKLQNEVEKVLRHHNLSFDLVACNSGGETFRFKTKLFEDLINKYKPEVFVMYDDRHEHLVQFEKWARFQPCRVEIIDVTKSDKTPKIINSNK